MTVSNDQLVRAVCERLRTLLAGFALRNPAGETFAPTLKVYPHNVPVPDSADEDRSEDDAPYIVVRAASGSRGRSFSDQSTTITIVALTWDDRPDLAGEADLLNMIDLIAWEFGQRPNVGAWRADGAMDWALGTDDIWPYFAGAITIRFIGTAPEFETEDLWA